MSSPYLLDMNEDEGVIGGLMGFLQEKQREPQPQVSDEAPYAPVHTGILRKAIAQRAVAYHIPEQFEVSGAGLFLFLDEGQTCDSFLESQAWKAYAEGSNVVTILLEPLMDGWSKKNITREMDFAKAVFADAIGRDAFSLNEATYYAFGMGAGAYPAAVFALLYASVLSGFAVDGDADLHPQLLKQLGAMPSDGDKRISHAQVEMPAWLLDREGSMEPLLTHLKTANHTEAYKLITAQHTTFLPEMAKKHASLDGLPCVQLRYSDAQQMACIKQDILKTALAFLLRQKRWINDKNGEFRPARTAEDMGLIRYEKQIGGRLRHWYVAVPENSANEQLPLVLALHGYSCTGKLFAENSGWHEVGNRRGFIVVYPTAYPCSMNGCTPLPLWNCDQFPGEEGINDAGFLLDVLQDVILRYGVDESRMYVAGHSNGSAMTQALMMRAGHLFAAFAPVGFTYGESLQPDRPDVVLEVPADGVQRPVWLIKGELDIGCASHIEENNANARFIDTMCRINQSVGEASHHSFGIYENDTWFDAQGVPVVRFTNAHGMPHAYTPEMAWLTWDLFFSRLSRGETGEIVYKRF